MLTTDALAQLLIDREARDLYLEQLVAAGERTLCKARALPPRVIIIMERLDGYTWHCPTC